MTPERAEGPSLLTCAAAIPISIKAYQGKLLDLDRNKLIGKELEYNKRYNDL